MNKFPSKVAVEARRARYKPGVRVELVSMDDPYTTLKSGDRGTVDYVDDTGTVFVNWDNGSTLGVVFGGDVIKAIPNLVSDVIKEQILTIRDTGKTNMFDVKAVFELSVALGFRELADFIFTDTARYSSFIIDGERG